MTYRKKTLRTMMPETRQLARLINDLESVTRRLKNYLPKVEAIELDARALRAIEHIGAASGEERMRAIRIIQQASHEGINTQVPEAT